MYNMHKTTTILLSCQPKQSTWCNKVWGRSYTKVDPTILTALGSIAAQQPKGTEKTYTDTLWLLNYAATHLNAKICYTASDMILHIHSNASYLSEPRSRSRAGGHYFLGDKRPDMSNPLTTRPRLNFPIHFISRIM